MKLFRNRGFVYILAGLAVLLVSKNLLWPFLGPKFARSAGGGRAVALKSAGASAAAPEVPRREEWKSPITAAPKAGTIKEDSPGGSGGPDAAPIAEPDAAMNVQELWTAGPKWISSPERDPFKMRGGVNDKSAREQLVLTGILRQTASDLAVLNNRVLSVGDTILGFRVETVEGDRVWVSGPNGRESLEFKYPVPLSRTAEPQPSAPSAREQAGIVPAGI